MSEITLKQRCDTLVRVLLGSSPELAEKWWHGPNRAFEERCPIDVPIKKVYDYLSFMAYH